jgi:hypothetical protein
MHVYDRWLQFAADVAGRCATRFVETRDIDNVGFEISDTESSCAARNTSRKGLSFA